MKKLLLTAAVTAALFAGQASAVVPTITSVAGAALAYPQVDFTDATGLGSLVKLPLTNTIYVAGSSAASKFLGTAVQSMAKEGTVVYLYQNANKDALTYVFEAKTGLTGFTQGQTYVVHKRDRDGSIGAALAASAKTPDAAKLVTFNQLKGTLVTKAVLAKDKTTVITPATYTAGSLLGLNIACLAPAEVTGFTSTLSTCKAAGLADSETDTKLAVAPKLAALVGIADVEAKQFASVLNGADSVNNLTKLVVDLKSTAIAAQVFGVAVNLKLRNAMQVAGVASGALTNALCATDATVRETEACMPSFTTPQLTSLFADGRMNDWTNLSYGAGNLVSANGTNIPSNTAVHLCSRAAGSGTLATFNTIFENAPCAGSDVKTGIQSVSEAIQAGKESVGNASTTEGAAGALKAYHSTVGSGDLENCLATMDGAVMATDGKSAVSSSPSVMATSNKFNLPTLNGTGDFRWAVGILNADRNEKNALPYRFVKIDGYAPSLVNTANGKYKYWSELARLDPKAASTAVAMPAANALLTTMSDPAVIVLSAKTHKAGYTTGYLATQSHATDGVTAFEPSRPVMPFTHANAAGDLNHCRAAYIPTGKKLLPGLN